MFMIIFAMSCKQDIKKVVKCVFVPQVCREYQRGNCTRGENDCRFAHPADSTMIDTNDNTVTVCMDYIKGRCSREKCKYFHPPAHLQAKIKAAQHQVNQAAAAAAMVGICPQITPPRGTQAEEHLKHHDLLSPVQPEELLSLKQM